MSGEHEQQVCRATYTHGTHPIAHACALAAGHDGAHNCPTCSTWWSGEPRVIRPREGTEEMT